MDLTARLDLLGRAPAFEALEPGDLRAIADRAKEIPFSAGQTLIRQGDAGDALWVMATGRAVVQLRRRGEDTLELARVGPGDVVGEMALVTGAPRTADVVATEGGLALVLLREDFEALARTRPGVVQVLTELVAERLGRAAVDGLGDKVVEGFRIVRPVGRGATAVVYEAESLVPGPAGGNRVALKMLSHRFSRDAAAMDAFERETRLLDEFAHEGVARSYGRFHAYGTCFLAIEYLDGPSAYEIQQAVGRLDVADALAIVGSVAEALGHCHVRGIVHGDVKPANVLVETTGRVVLTDFGIASRVDAPAADQGMRVSGTPRYMAPELFVGARPSASSDLYALGCMLWELIQGEPVFPQSDLVQMIVAKRRFHAPEPHALRADLPGSVLRVLAATLHADPEQRARSAADLALPASRVSPQVVAGTLRRRASV